MKLSLTSLCLTALSLSPFTTATAFGTRHPSHALISKRRLNSPGAASPAMRRRRSGISSRADGACRVRPSNGVAFNPAPAVSSSQVVQIQAAAKVEPDTSSVWSAPTSSSVWVAPTPSPAPASVYQAPAPAVAAVVASPVAAPAPAVVQAPTPAPAPAPASSGGGFSGVATFYDPGLGACGITNHDGDYIVAVSRSLFDGFQGYTGGNPNANPICNKKAVVSLGGNSLTVIVTDRCEACALHDLDFTPQVFAKLVAGVTQNSNTGLGIGRASGLTWSWA